MIAIRDAHEDATPDALDRCADFINQYLDPGDGVPKPCAADGSDALIKIFPVAQQPGDGWIVIALRNDFPPHRLGLAEDAVRDIAEARYSQEKGYRILELRDAALSIGMGELATETANQYFGEGSYEAYAVSSRHFRPPVEAIGTRTETLPRQLNDVQAQCALMKAEAERLLQVARDDATPLGQIFNSCVSDVVRFCQNAGVPPGSEAARSASALPHIPSPYHIRRAGEEDPLRTAIGHEVSDPRTLAYVHDCLSQAAEAEAVRRYHVIKGFVGPSGAARGV